MFHTVSILLLLMAPQAPGSSTTQSVERLQIDCATSLDVSKEEAIETAEEKAARYDADFRKALMLMDKCINKVTEGAAAAGGGGGGGAAGGASGGLKGTDAPETEALESEVSAEADETVEATDSQGTQSPATESSGKNIVRPSDIPSGHDDDIVAQQLRELAEKETDPTLRKKYWDQYRKYKGLDPVN